MKTQLLQTHWNTPHAEGGEALKCDATRSHLQTFEHVKPKCRERLVTDTLLD